MPLCRRIDKRGEERLLPGFEKKRSIASRGNGMRRKKVPNLSFENTPKKRKIQFGKRLLPRGGKKRGHLTPEVEGSPTRKG